jgi:hypothetical protein
MSALEESGVGRRHGVDTMWAGLEGQRLHAQPSDLPDGGHGLMLKSGRSRWFSTFSAIGPGRGFETGKTRGVLIH